MIRSTGALLVLLSLTAPSACSPSASATDAGDARGPGRLVIVGGALQAENAAVYEAVIEGRAGDGPICVVPTASAAPQESMDGAVERLARYGGPGSAKGVLISTEYASRAREPSVVSDLATCSGYYFTGGSQSRILDVFLPAGDTTEAYRTVWRRWQEGAVVAGSSAGAAMMSRVMIAGGGSDEAVEHGFANDEDSDGVRIRDGMGFFEAGLLDQHFLARGRVGRLLVAVLREESPRVGFGIDENTAMVVDGDSAAVVGASGVVVVDGRSAQRTEPHRASELRVHLAGAGDVIDLQTLEVRRQSTKSTLTVTDEPVDLPEDPFARWAFLHLVKDLAGSSVLEATFNLPDATLTIVEDAGFSASVSEPTGGVEGTPSGFSAGPFKVDLLDPEF